MDPPRDCVSPRAGRRESVREPVPVMRHCGNPGRLSSPASREFFAARTYLSPGRRMFHGNGSRRGPRANRGENKVRRGPRAAPSAENMVYGTTGLSCIYGGPSRLRPEQMPLSEPDPAVRRAARIIFLHRGENVVIVRWKSW